MSSFYILGSDALGCAVLGGAERGYVDGDTVRTVQRMIAALPQYKTDKALSLEPYGVDGKWGPTTAKAVERFNAYYRAGGAKDNDGPHITDGTIEALERATGGKAASAAAAPSASAAPSAVPTAFDVSLPATDPIAQAAVASALAAFSRDAAPAPSLSAYALSPSITPAWKYALGAAAFLALGAGVYFGVRR